MTMPLATVGILSIGEMGLGIAKLLVAHNYRVVTNLAGRSGDTKARTEAAKIESLSNDEDLVRASDYIISILPPRDAFNTAKRVVNALESSSVQRNNPLYYVELNAISPRSAREIAALFKDPTVAVPVDGGVIGGAPRRKDDSTSTTTISSQHITHSEWTRPSIPVSGPYKIASAPISGSHLAETLNMKHISDDIGPASGLKMCFATTSKGFIALAIQSFTTAHKLGVLDELKHELRTFAPSQLQSAEKGIVGMSPKAYRWVREMEEIADTHADEAGFEKELMKGVAGVYKAVAEETVLGLEKTENRKRGTTVEDVALAVGEGLGEKKKKTE